MYCSVDIKIFIKEKLFKSLGVKSFPTPIHSEVPFISINIAVHITIPSRMSSMTGLHHSIFSNIFLVCT
jgi:hypothetical protein